jgi:hypothetical protein
MFEQHLRKILMNGRTRVLSGRAMMTACTRAHRAAKLAAAPSEKSSQ